MSKKDASHSRYSTPQRGSGRRKAVIVVTVIVAIAAVALVSFYGLQTVFSEPEVVSVAPRTTFGNVIVQGVSLDGMTQTEAEDALTQALRQQDAGRSYTLTLGDTTVTLAASSLQITYNTDDILKDAWDAAEPVVSTASSEAPKGFFAALFGQEEEVSSAPVSSAPPKEFTLTPTVNADALKTTLEGLTKDMNIEKVEPTVSGFDAASETFSFDEGQDGQQVDLDTLTANVKSLVESALTGTVEVPVTAVPREHTVEDLQSHMTKLGHFTTESSNTENGTYNMTRALETVNGTVVGPGETFSFLGIVGAADEAAGYKLAGAIQNGVSTQDYGGGICQASTTIYGAAVRSNCEIVERSNHSIPSKYVQIGQDAAVSYPSLDFKFKNPTDYPMYIQSGANGRTMYCTIYGYNDGSWDTIEVTSQQTEVIPQPADETVEDASLPSGTRQLQSSGRQGYRAVAQRVFYKDGAVVRSEDLPSSYYPPKANVYAVGTG